RNIPQTCLASTILFHGCEFCLLCIFTHDASKGCIQPSGVTPEREERSFCNCRARENTIVRRSASHAVLDAPRPILKRYQSSTSNWSLM
ncbi:hypothetical protein B0A93_01405, partial [Pseudomonas syringae]